MVYGNAHYSEKTKETHQSPESDYFWGVGVVIVLGSEGILGSLAKCYS